MFTEIFKGQKTVMDGNFETIIVNCVWAISTLIITSCCTCHNYICNLFLNDILAAASVSYGHFF